MTDDDVPLLPGEVLGYRVWRMGVGALASYVSVHPDAETVWRPGVVQARCRRGHDAPHPGCSCGLHGGPQLDFERGSILVDLF